MALCQIPPYKLIFEHFTLSIPTLPGSVLYIPDLGSVYRCVLRVLKDPDLSNMWYRDLINRVYCSISYTTSSKSIITIKFQASPLRHDLTIASSATSLTCCTTAVLAWRSVCSQCMRMWPETPTGRRPSYFNRSNLTCMSLRSVVNVYVFFCLTLQQKFFNPKTVVDSWMHGSGKFWKYQLAV